MRKQAKTLKPAELRRVLDYICKRRSKNRSQYAAGAAFCGGVKVVRR
ncbi:MAG: integrase, partial [Acidobacteria bacterium]